MRKILNVSLYVIIFLLVAAINVISIKKFFDNKEKNYLKDILATNFVTDFVSFNRIEEDIVESENVEDVKENFVTEEVSTEEIKEDTVSEEIIEETIKLEEVEKSESIINSDILYDGLTEEELIVKLDKSLKNELSGTSINFIEYYKNTGLDPYLAAAIVLHETGCTWNCSNLVKECFNFGGMKGGEKLYKDTRYSCYSSKEEGINAYLNMLYNNYYSKGLTTAELINPKYASSLEWAVKINNYISKIKNN